MTERSSKLPFLAFALTFSGLVLFAAVRDLLEQQGRDPRHVVPNPTSAVREVGGWRGPANLEAEGLRLQLAPLHTDSERQAFDAKVLGERLGLGPGQPFRLEVSVQEGSKSPEYDRLAAAASAGELYLEDHGGRVGGLLFFGTGGVMDGAEPILRLFDPAETVGLERHGRLVFWGRPPGEGARLSGPDIDWRLTAGSLSRDELPRFVASRDKVSR